MAYQIEPAHQELRDAHDHWVKGRDNFMRSMGAEPSTRGFEIDLQHFADHLGALAESALNRATTIDWAAVVPDYLDDLQRLNSAANQIEGLASHESKVASFLGASKALLDLIRTIPVPEEGHLGFRATVLNAFSFLETEYGFRVRRTSPITVRYEAESIYVEVQHAPSFPELTFTMGRMNPSQGTESSFYLDDVSYMGTGMLDYPVDTDPEPWKTREGVITLIKQMAQLVEQHAKPLFSGDPEAWARLEKAQRDREDKLGKVMGQDMDS